MTKWPLFKGTHSPTPFMLVPYSKTSFYSHANHYVNIAKDCPEIFGSDSRTQPTTAQANEDRE